MSPDQEHHLEEIFSAARELPPHDRPAFLEGACGGDSELRRQADSLLAAHEQVGQFLQPTVALPTASLPAEGSGDRIGRYKLLEQIGEGGFGVVWMAEQEEPVRRRVALKIIKLGMDTREVVARFEAERQALAMMDHPHIASVFDGGATDTGRPYFVMELVKGIPITDYCDANKLSTRERLELFMQVCQAVQHAHQKGVIHRDLKPSNILVTVQDDRPVPKVIDFGIAKATQARLTEKTLFTRLQQRIGTPAYMSPEQAGLGSLDVDTRSDIYSLGVLLYELLTGRTPFDTQKLLAAGYDAVMRTIREEEPPKPSTRLSTLADEELSTVAAHRGAEPAKLGRLVRGDLDWIVMKALEKDRTRRYETANAFARDVEAYLGQEPVSAAAPTVGYRLTKFARRNRVALSTAAIFVLLLLAGTTMSVWQAVRATRFAREAGKQRQIATNEAARATQLAGESEKARRRADEQAVIAAAVNEFLEKDLLARAVPQSEAEEKPEPYLKVRTVLDRASEKIAGRFGDQPLVEASLRATMASAYHELGFYATQELHARRAAELYARQLGETNAQALRMMAAVGDAERHLGRGMEAVQQLQHVREIEERVFGPAHTNTLRTMNLLGVAYANAGQSDQGEALLKESLRRAEASPARESPIVGGLLNNLALLLADDGRLEEAEQVCRRQLAFTLERKGPVDRQTLGSRFHLATVLTREEKYPEAETLFREAIVLSDKLGWTNEEDGTLLGNLATVLFNQKKLSEAEAACRGSLALRRAHWGQENPWVADALTRLAGLLLAGERSAEAESLLDEAVKIVKSQPDVPDSIALQAYLTRWVVLREQSKQVELASAFRDLEAWEKSRPTVSREVLRSTVLRAAFLREQGKVAEGEALLSGNWQAATCAALDDNPRISTTTWKPLTADEALQKLTPLVESASKTNLASHVALWARAALFGQQGQSKEAAADLARWFELQDDGLGLPLVPLWLDSGDTSRCERYRHQLWARYNRSPGHAPSGRLEYTPGEGWGYRFAGDGDPATAAGVALALTLDPAAPSYKGADSLGRFAVERGTNHARLPYFQMVLGLAEYRFGRFESAAEYARRSLAGAAIEPPTAVMANAVLAMATRQLHQFDKATQALRQAKELLRTNLPPVKDGTQNLGENWPDWLSARALVKEAGMEKPQQHASQVLPQPPTGEATRSNPSGGRVYLPTGIAALVNSRPILNSEVRDKLSPAVEALRRQYTNNPALGEQKLQEQTQVVLEGLVNDELILTEALEAGRKITEEHLDHYTQDMIQTKFNGDSNLFLGTLAAQGTTLEEWQERHAHNDLVTAAKQEKVAALPPPAPEQIEQYYHSHEKDFWMEKRVQLRLIVMNKNPTNGQAAVESQHKLAAEIRDLVAAGRDFAYVAQIYSQGSQGRKGGDWGWVERRVLRKELGDAAFSLQPGEVSDVIETEEAFFIMRVADRRPGTLKPMAEVREEIVKTLQTQARSSVTKQWLDSLHAKAFLRYYGSGVDTGRPQDQVVRIEIKHIGVATVSDALIRSHLRVKESELVTQAKVDHDIRSLYGTGSFYSIRVAAEKVAGGIKLIYLVQEKPLLTAIQFTGNTSISSRELLPKLASQIGERLDEWKMFRDSQAIQRMYQRAGYPQATVKYVPNIDELTGRGSVTLEVTEDRNSVAPLP